MRTALVRFGAAALLAAFFLAGCASPPVRRPVEPLAAWTQLAPAGGLDIRAAVPAGAACPLAEVDGEMRPLERRAADEVFPSAAAGLPFGADSCQLRLSAGQNRQIRVGQRTLAVLPVKPEAVQRIVVVGDTGCRVKLGADGKGDPLQACWHPLAWPWSRIAEAAAATKPQVVIHLGDFHYREVCDHPIDCRELKEKGIVLGYSWPAWQADFFAPAAPLLAAAPWVMVRGNHENCDRAGEGWMRFLAPQAYAACAGQRQHSSSRSTLANNHTAEAYHIDLGSVELALVDNAAHDDYRSATDPRTGAAAAAVFARTLAPLATGASGRPRWLLAHKPLWYDLIGPAAEPNAFQNALKGGLGDVFQAVFSGHMHAFATLGFAAGADPAYPSGRPVQIVVGSSGTQVEARDPASLLYEGGASGSRERMVPEGRSYDGVPALGGIVLNRDAFLLLERRNGGWDGSVRGPQGSEITRCRLDDGQKRFDCRTPQAVMTR